MRPIKVRKYLVLVTMCSLIFFAEAKAKIATHKSNGALDEKEDKDDKSRKPVVQINREALTLHKGRVRQLKVEGTDKRIRWSSKNEAVAMVDAEGRVWGVDQGVTTILAKVGKRKRRCQVTVAEKGLGLVNYTVIKGKGGVVNWANVKKKAAKKVKWSSTNPRVAVIKKNGTFTGVSAGVVDMEGKAGKKRYRCRVAVGIPKNAVYLTFDDGPSSDVTPRILDILKRRNIKATFFVVNYSVANEKLIKRIVKEGHTLALHGLSHVYRDIYRSEAAFMKNITRLRKKLFKLTGKDCTIMRFPGGSSNSSSKFNPGVMTRLTSLVQEEGYRYFDWNVSAEDAERYKSKGSVYRNVTSGLRKHRVNVVLCHDFGGNHVTCDALDDVIDYAQNRGYTFRRISKRTELVQHKPIPN